MNEQKKPRGFAVMNREKVREISSKGGKAAHAAGTAHEWTREEAIEAGRKGGKATHANKANRPIPYVPTDDDYSKRLPPVLSRPIQS